MSTILIIEDDDHVADLIKKGLREDGYKVLHTIDGIAGMELLAKEEIELVVLDILLPKMNGLEVCRKIKTEGYAHLPILMLTALGSAENVVLGLDSGADDYLAKPFKLIELKARVRTLLRRKKISGPTSNDHSAIYRFAEIELNDNTKMVTRNGKEMSLTSTEYRLLMMFLKNPKMVLSRSSILDEIWGINFDIGTNVVDVYVNYLRKKLDKLGDKKLIHTVIGMGYILKES
jgi:DNA-binding response OmpR family regulator